MGDSNYPARYSRVEVTYTDGEVETHYITAGPGIGKHLARGIGETGILQLFNGTKSVGIPMDGVRNYTLDEISEADFMAATQGGAA